MPRISPAAPITPLVAPLVLALFLCCGAAPAQTRPAEWAQPVVLEQAENFFRVTPSLYRSAQPNAKAMRAYADFGIKTVINLRGFHDDADEAAGTPLVLRRVPINAWDIDEDEVVEALALILASPAPVLLHCMHGADRTGLVVAAYRVTQQGWTKEAAEREMTGGGFGFHSVWANIPPWLHSMDAARVKRLSEDRARILAERND